MFGGGRPDAEVLRTRMATAAQLTLQAKIEIVAKPSPDGQGLGRHRSNGNHYGDSGGSHSDQVGLQNAEEEAVRWGRSPVMPDNGERTITAGSFLCRKPD
jgi:hypothetical protein